MPQRTTQARAAYACLLGVMGFSVACGGGEDGSNASTTGADASFPVERQNGGPASASDGGVGAATDAGESCAVCPVCLAPDGGASSPPPWFVGDAGGRSVFWVAEGDSMTHPDYADAGDGVYRYPALAGILLGTSVTVTNLGASGDTVADMLAMLPYEPPYTPDGGAACVWTLLGGTNDIRSDDAGPSDVCALYAAYAAGVHARGCKFVAITIPGPDHFVTPAARDALNDCIRRVPGADAVIDLAAVSDFDSMTIDGTHPSRDGHVRIAQMVAPAIREVLLDAGATMP